jgi:hypothetical protein
MILGQTYKFCWVPPELLIKPFFEFAGFFKSAHKMKKIMLVYIRKQSANFTIIDYFLLEMFTQKFFIFLWFVSRF